MKLGWEVKNIATAVALCLSSVLYDESAFANSAESFAYALHKTMLRPSRDAIPCVVPWCNRKNHIIIMELTDEGSVGWLVACGWLLVLELEPCFLPAASIGQRASLSTDLLDYLVCRARY